MAVKDTFTADEWEALVRGASGAGFLVAVSDRGFFDTFKEAGALARHLAGGRESQSELVRELAGERPHGFGMTASPSEIEQETLSALRTALAAVEQKAPAEVEPYRAFVLDVAQSVSDAAGGGDQAEDAAIEKVREALAGEATV
jgi:hypothetical protein